MDFYDYIINRNAAQEKNPGKLSSYQQAAELICLCWNRLDMSFVMSQVFDSLQYSKRTYRADVDGSGDRVAVRSGSTAKVGKFVKCASFRSWKT